MKPKQMLRDDVMTDQEEYAIHTSAKTQKKMQIFICTFTCLLSPEWGARWRSG